jgi:N-methylhydantoinase B
VTVTDSRRAPTQFPFGHLTADAGASADPVLVEIVQGSLASVEMEVETAIGRTSRSPMIRDAHDFRAGIHDRLLRKLTGRSYSALVHPVARDFPIEEMREGDVFFHNDVYQSEGGIGHLPTCASPCRSSPARRATGGSWRSCRPSATTTTSAAPSPARCPRTPPACSRRA